ncbi:hypothetical protein CLV58_11931 [Spirosoma oryzae]|uniref:Uncharacterized protein n=1 Tax=Spirosoma oryzae TaxID=1469603 RepID=A0A2T0SKE3_9BACT|nr:hypothetical protein [Spirosoma oryzae]PRY33882.1 hypothetical protein CLV58_11931 [Spirosoma oryzae]
MNHPFAVGDWVVVLDDITHLDKVFKQLTKGERYQILDTDFDGTYNWVKLNFTTEERRCYSPWMYTNYFEKEHPFLTKIRTIKEQHEI